MKRRRLISGHWRGCCCCCSPVLTCQQDWPRLASSAIYLILCRLAAAVAVLVASLAKSVGLVSRLQRHWHATGGHFSISFSLSRCCRCCRCCCCRSPKFQNGVLRAKTHFRLPLNSQWRPPQSIVALVALDANKTIRLVAKMACRQGHFRSRPTRLIVCQQAIESPRSGRRLLTVGKPMAKARQTDKRGTEAKPCRPSVGATIKL